jgi:trigger factor
LKIEQETLDTCEAKLTVELEAAQVEEAKRKAARKLAQRYAIPGFRKGKAPYEIILRTVGEGAVLEAAMEALSQDVYKQALDELDLDPVGPGQMIDAKIDPAVFTYTVPLRPEVDLGNYREVRLGYTPPDVTEEALTDAMEHMREHEAVLEPVERPAQPGDVVTLDVSGRVLPEPPAAEEEADPAAEPAPGGSEAETPAPAEPVETFLMDDKDVDVLLDPKLNWPAPGFAEKLDGIQADEARQIELTFPDDYANESLRGKQARFEVKCKGVKSRTLPAWDDELSKTLGHESLADMRVKVQDSLLTQAQRRVEEEYTKSVVDIVVSGSTVKYPPYLFDRELEEMTEDLDRRLREQNITLEDYKRITKRTDEQIREELEPSARERLRRSLVLGKVIETEGITVPEEEVSDRIESIASIFGKDANRYRKMMSSDTARRSVRYDLLSDRAVQRLVAIAKGENPPAAESIEILSETNEPAPAGAVEPEPNAEAPEDSSPVSG